MKIEIHNQCLVDSKIIPVHMGEVLSLMVDEQTKPIAEIGWIDWCKELGSRPNIPTARLEIVGSAFEVLVAKPYRIPDLSIGQKLFEEMSNRLRGFGYVDLLVFGAINHALPFYIKTFKKLTDLNIAAYYGRIKSPSRNTIDNHDFRVIYRP